jgi:hypothetical protein
VLSTVSFYSVLRNKFKTHPKSVYRATRLFLGWWWWIHTNHVKKTALRPF